MRRPIVALLLCVLPVLPATADGRARITVPIPPGGGLTLARAQLTIKATSGRLGSATQVTPSFSGAVAGGAILAGPTTIALDPGRRSGKLTALVAVIARGGGGRAAATAAVTFSASRATLGLAARPERVSARVERIGFAGSGGVCGFHARTMSAALEDLVAVRSSNPSFAAAIGLQPAAALASTADVFCHLPGYDAPATFLAKVQPGYRRPTAKFTLAADPVVPNSRGVGHVKACLTVTTSPAQSKAVAEIHVTGRGVGVGDDQNLPLGGGGGAATHFSLNADGPFTVTVTLFARNGAVKTVRTRGTFDHLDTDGPATCAG